MRVIDFVQGSDLWLAWRNQGITATDSVTILGKNPDLTPWGLWAQKTGLQKAPDLSKNPYVRRGGKLEPVARKWMQEAMGKVLLPVCGEWTTNPLFRASFDGVSDNGTPVELKVPSENNFQEVKALREQSTAYKRYYIQVQHQLLVADAMSGYLVFFHEKESPIHFLIQRDQAVIDEIIIKGGAFWGNVLGTGEPGLDPERDLFLPKTADQEKKWLASARSYRAAYRKAKELEVELKGLKAMMKENESIFISIMDEFMKADFAGIQVTRFEKSGAVDYKKYLNFKVDNFDESELEGFRRNPTKQTKVTPDADWIDEKIVEIETEAERTDVAVNAWI